MAFCTQCGGSIADDAAFCTTCGTSCLPAKSTDQAEEASVPDRSDDPGPPESELAAEPESHVCRSCDFPIESGTSFCTQCGSATPAAPDSESVEPATPVADVHPDEPASACASCGAGIGTDSAFCISCGTPVAVGTSAVAAATAAETSFGLETTETRDDHEPPDSPSEDPAVEHSEPEDTASEVAPTRVIPSTEGAICENCGSPLEAGALFCVTCGTQTGEPLASAQGSETDDSQRRSRSRPFVIATIVVIVVAMIAAGAWFGWKQLSSNGDEPDETALPAGTTAATGGQEETPPTTAPTTTVVDETLCWDLGVRALDATQSLAIAFETVDFDELVSMARIDRTALPGAMTFDTEKAAIDTEAAENGCETGSVESAYTTELSSRTPPSGANASLVWTAAQNSQGNDGDPLTQADSALRLYPIHGSVTSAAAPPEAGLPKWVVMLASLNTNDSDRADAQARADEYTAMGLPAEILLTDVYGSLTPGYWAVFTGPYPDRDQARDYARSIKATVSDAYQRYVQVLPSTDQPFGQCGPYGMIDVSGVDADKFVPVLSRPENDRVEVVRLPGTTTGVLVAGPAENAGGSWTPLAVNGTIGWIKTQYTTDNATCPRTDPIVSGVSCTQIATAAVDLFTEISNSAAGASETGTVPSISPGGFDDAAARLVDQASASGCSASELNTLIAVDKSRIAPANAFAELTVQALYAAPFFVDG